ncbi:CPBP family intramembrane glutamic endopeptidase [Pseudoalteromonas tunicata]|uniref:Putative intracellular septation protein n=1 Tax=Pseudoalteromonas tunicata D2 TaxID=87626 RepID=A4CBJ3_9GAMM|nr:CPBP family intramembrane glutamic endopeptidase [Pseudoalteromonas tunicata]ATC94287.1 hypothetical protein PTUN_a1689 [Pseudoalteromonas tunicata]AXT30031.1 CPBP family intramembrane metalloprotease [Pseudoalteromonas tunicata]EAR27730.1 putative intracellular septation protein [Pseudoalteromonas tunicata D2]MDP4982077.1 CPBP family intramembrane metalloprotease [Pseudoalteromonas tunicata]
MNYSYYRWFELIAVFIVLPLIGYLMKDQLKLLLIPTLLLLTVWCCFLLLKDPKFKRFRLTNVAQLSVAKKRILTFFSAGVVFSCAFYALLNQEKWFQLPLESPLNWLMLIVFYPLVSVMPQELIYRTYFFHRYKKIIPDKRWRILLSASTFSLAHIIYDNWVAVLLSFAGGLMFAYTYAHSRSTFACVVEHSIWGLWLFSLGLGQYLDSGAIVST